MATFTRVKVTYLCVKRHKSGEWFLNYRHPLFAHFCPGNFDVKDMRRSVCQIVAKFFKKMKKKKADKFHLMANVIIFYPKKHFKSFA